MKKKNLIKLGYAVVVLAAMSASQMLIAGDENPGFYREVREQVSRLESKMKVEPISSADHTEADAENKICSAKCHENMSECQHS